MNDRQISGEPWPDMTLSQAKQWLRERVINGEAKECPCCTQLAKVYKRKLNSGMAVILLVMHQAPRGWIHIQQYLAERTFQPNVKKALANREWAKLSYWGLLREATDDDKDLAFEGSKTTGYWMLTPAGEQFVLGQRAVPKHIHLFDGRMLGHSDESITIQQALGDKFDYQQLMDAPLDSAEARRAASRKIGG